MWRLLGLLIQDKAVGVPDQWSVVCVEENLVWKLCGQKQMRYDPPDGIHLHIKHTTGLSLPSHRAWSCRSQR